MVESWHCHSALMAVNAKGFFSQPIYLLLQQRASSLNRTSLKLFPHDTASPEMSTQLKLCLCIIYLLRDCFFPFSFSFAFWTVSTVSCLLLVISLLDTRAESCCQELQKEKWSISCGYSASLPVTPEANLQWIILSSQEAVPSLPTLIILQESLGQFERRCWS